MEDQNKVFFYLIKNFIDENKYLLIILTTLAIISGFIQTEGISVTTAKIIDNIDKMKIDKIWNMFWILLTMYFVFQFTHFLFWHFEYILSSYARPWGKFKLFELISEINNDEYSESNFALLLTPLNRLSALLSQIMSDIASFFLPNVIFFLIVCSYIFKIDPMFSLFFFIGILCVFTLFYFNLSNLYNKNIKYEESEFIADATLIDSLNNMDKIIFRGQINEQLKKYKKLCFNNFDKSKNYFTNSNCLINIMSTLLLSVFLFSFGYLIELYRNKKINTVKFITTITILTLLREKLDALFTQIPDFLRYFGNIQVNSKHLSHIGKRIEKLEKMKKNKKKNELNFDNIKFENVSYSYKNNNENKFIFKNKNLEINIEDNSIIGITGESGSGKSTIMKLLIKVYPINEGNILIDNINIKNMDTNILRKHITYVNQNSKLFDEKVINNLLYGCNEKDICKKRLDIILKYPTIANLYKNVNIYKKDAGQLGENLSGGQRQVANLISGLINPSKILILDEPTNALDPKLKNEIIEIIIEFKKYKKAIFIITHDKEVFQIFDQQIKLTK